MYVYLLQRQFQQPIFMSGIDANGVSSFILTALTSDSRCSFSESSDADTASFDTEKTKIGKGQRMSKAKVSAFAGLTICAILVAVAVLTSAISCSNGKTGDEPALPRARASVYWNYNILKDTSSAKLVSGLFEAAPARVIPLQIYCSLPAGESDADILPDFIGSLDNRLCLFDIETNSLLQYNNDYSSISTLFDVNDNNIIEPAIGVTFDIDDRVCYFTSENMFLIKPDGVTRYDNLYKINDLCKFGGKFYSRNIIGIINDKTPFYDIFDENFNHVGVVNSTLYGWTSDGRSPYTKTVAAASTMYAIALDRVNCYESKDGITFESGTLPVNAYIQDISRKNTAGFSSDPKFKSLHIFADVFCFEDKVYFLLNNTLLEHYGHDRGDRGLAVILRFDETLKPDRAYYFAYSKPQYRTFDRRICLFRDEDEQLILAMQSTATVAEISKSSIVNIFRLTEE